MLYTYYKVTAILFSDNLIEIVNTDLSEVSQKRYSGRFFWVYIFFYSSTPHEAIQSPLLLNQPLHFSLFHETRQYYHKMFTFYFWYARFNLCSHQLSSFKFLSPLREQYFFSDIRSTQASVEITLLCLYCHSMFTYYSSIFCSSPSLGFPFHSVYFRQRSHANI